MTAQSRCDSNRGALGSSLLLAAGMLISAASHGATVNETNLPAEMDYCIVQFPVSITVGTAGELTQTIYARVFEAGVTEAAGPSSLIAQIGYGPQALNPASQTGYTWFAASYNAQVGNDDEYVTSFPAPSAGVYGYTARFSPDGVNWICQGSASTFGLPGTYKALLAVQGASAASRFNTAGAPWVRVDGVRVFDPASQLLASTMKAPLNVTATGLYASNMTIWTGAPDFATAGTAETTCGNWSSTAGTVYFGRTDQSSDFFNSSSDCTASRRVLCLQQ